MSILSFWVSRISIFILKDSGKGHSQFFHLVVVEGGGGRTGQEQNRHVLSAFCVSGSCCYAHVLDEETEAQ